MNVVVATLRRLVLTVFWFRASCPSVVFTGVDCKDSSPGKKSRSVQRKSSAMALPILTLLALCFVNSQGTVVLNYTEVQKLGNSCPQLESCGSVRSRELFTIKEKNCVCDDLCVEYGDCCIDAPRVAVRTAPTAYHCYDLRQYGGVYMKDSCPERYDGPQEVRTLCETTRLGDMRDPLASMPVSDSRTGSTYKNYYCSICHGAAGERMVMWTPRLSCPTVKLYAENMTEAFVIENLTQVGENNWGLYLTDEDNDDGSLFFHDCEVDPSMPKLLERLIRLCKPNLVSDCPDDWADEDSRSMCESYMGTRYIHGGDRYKNAHCAMCHGMNVSHLSCRTVESRDWDFRAFETHAFALLLDVSERRGSEVGRVRMCEAGEVFDPFFKMCRSLTCLRGFVKKGKECVLKEDSSESGEGPVHPVVELSGVYDSRGHVPYESIPEVSEEVDVVDRRQKDMVVPYNATSMVESEREKFQNCLLISLNDADFVMFPNKSIFVPKYDKMYDPASYLIEEGSVVVCSHLENDGNSNKFVPFLSYLTIFGLCVSMLCLLLHFVAFCYVPDLQNLSGKNLVSQGVSLFCAYTCFCIGLADSFSPSSCITLAFSKYYFFQASYFWMAVIAFDVWRTLRMATQQLRVTNGKQRRRFLTYSLFAWCGPLLTMSIMAWAEFTDDFPELYKPSFANSLCWFRRRRSLLVYFVAPLILVLVINVVFFVHSYVMIHSTTQTTSKQQTQANKRNHKLYLRLALLMGLTWVIGIVAGYADFQPLWYAYVLANAFQGFYIFAAFTCSTKVVNFFKEKFKLNTRPRDSTHSGSNCHTSSTNLPVHSSLAKKLSSKLLVKKNSESNTSAGSIDLDPQRNAV